MTATHANADSNDCEERVTRLISLNKESSQRNLEYAKMIKAYTEEIEALKRQNTALAQLMAEEQ